ncbi:hypothetical protein D3C76_1610610 [compost metagenome]
MPVNAYDRNIIAHIIIDIGVSDAHDPGHLVLAQHIEIIELLFGLAAAVAQHQLVAFPVQLVLNIIGQLRKEGIPDTRQQ